ncbi:hypothetical protein BJ165DRAFT_828195 [Panaeolus papilionaceus]|nr:hypothetical protein BJ165DRAFT_828195 [Panaeolus papilionaceus]
MSAVISSNSPTNTIPSLPTTLQGPRSFINLTHSGTTTTTTTNNAMRASPPVPQRYQPPNPIDPPTGISYAAFLRTWNDDHVLKWLTEIKCASHYDAFTTNEIKGDVLLELDQTTLKEMGITSIGDRLRIINAVKVLRQRVAASRASVAPLSIHKNNNSVDFSYNPPKSESSNTKNVNRRLENVRPPALQLNPNTRSADLPSVLRDQPDSARTVVHPHNTTITVPNGPSTSNSNISLASSIRPLPQPTPITSSTPPSNPPSTITSTGTPSSAHTPGSVRPVLPPLPPPPRGQPPLPPGATRVGAGRNLPPSSGEPPVYQPPPPPGSTATAQNGTATPTTTGTPRTAHLPADPRPGNVGGQKFGLGIGPAARSISPIPPTRVRPAVSPGPGSTHNRMGSTSANVNGGAPTKGLPGRPGANNNTNTATPAASNHPYATAGAAILSPIDEAFPSSSQGSQSTTSSFSVGKGPFPATPNPQGGSGSPNNGSAANGVTNPSLTDLRRKLVKFVLPEQEQGFGPGVGLSFTIDVAACAGGVEVLERVLRKFGSSGIGKEGSVLQVGQTDEGGLVVDGYGVFLDRNLYL